MKDALHSAMQRIMDGRNEGVVVGTGEIVGGAGQVPHKLPYRIIRLMSKPVRGRPTEAGLITVYDSGSVSIAPDLGVGDAAVLVMVGNHSARWVKVDHVRDGKVYAVPPLGDDEVLIVKVGNDEHPATEQDIHNIQALLAQVKSDPQLVLVTHHCVEFEVLKRRHLDNLFFKGCSCSPS